MTPEPTEAAVEAACAASLIGAGTPWQSSLWDKDGGAHRQRLRCTISNALRAAYAIDLSALQARVEALEAELRMAREDARWRRWPEEVPEPDTACVVLEQFNGHWIASIDEWCMQRESPVEWSSATVETGYMWNDHDGYDISWWRPLGRLPELDAARQAGTEGG